jgi:hypothetical protein
MGEGTAGKVEEGTTPAMNMALALVESEFKN